MAAISGGSGPHQQHPGGLGASKKAARKESPDPPPRELILASPDLRLNSKSRLSWSSLTLTIRLIATEQPGETANKQEISRKGTQSQLRRMW